ncbi:MAG TPA: hypothetical protein V6D06_07295 [Trichocoleus sp.]
MTAVGTVAGSLLPQLALLLGLSGLVWSGQAAFNPPAAVAYTSRVSLFLVREQDESFESLVRRAEIAARAGVQRSFDADLLVTEAIVTIVGENQGITVPILTVEVTRSQWRGLPDVVYWSQYYETANSLLRF